MHVVYNHPLGAETSYHDGTKWLRIEGLEGQKSGIWLKPGQALCVVDMSEREKAGERLISLYLLERGRWVGGTTSWMTSLTPEALLERENRKCGNTGFHWTLEKPKS